MLESWKCFVRGQGLDDNEAAGLTVDLSIEEEKAAYALAAEIAERFLHVSKPSFHL